MTTECPHKKKKLIEWIEKCQLAFDKLKELCTTTPILAHADYTLMQVNWD